jgi:hypothetical protein
MMSPNTLWSRTGIHGRSGCDQGALKVRVLLRTGWFRRVVIRWSSLVETNER